MIKNVSINKVFNFKHIIYKNGISHKMDSFSFGNIGLLVVHPE